jgi:hypothetical protein
MEKLIETIVSLLEIMVLGTIAIGILGYLAALFNSTRKMLRAYLNVLSKILLDRNFQNYSEWIKIGLALGFVYFAGILANSAAYWVLSRGLHSGTARYHSSNFAEPNGFDRAGSAWGETRWGASRFASTSGKAPVLVHLRRS